MTSQGGPSDVFGTWEKISNA